MEFKDGIGDKAIQDVITEHPEIGEILKASRSAASLARWASAC